MSDEALHLLTSEELITLAGQDEGLLRPGDDDDPQAWLMTLLEVLAEERTYAKAMTHAFEQDNIEQALGLASAARERGASIPDRIKTEVDSAWETWRDEFQATIDTGKRRLEDAPEHEAITQLKDQYATTLQAVSPPSRLPSDSGEWRSCLNSKEEALRTIEDIDALIAVATEDTEQTTEQLWAQSLEAWSVVLTRVREQRFQALPEDADLLRVLPELVLRRQIEPLEQIARGETPVLPRQSIPQFKQSRRETLHRYVEQMNDGWGKALGPLPDGTALLSMESVLQLEKETLQDRSGEEVARHWFAAEQKTTDEILRAVARAKGLNCLGWHSIHQKQPIRARKQFEDVLRAVSRCRIEDVEELLRHAFHGLIIAKSWPHLCACAQATTRPDGAVVSEWSKNLRQPVEYLASHAELDVLAMTWIGIEHDAQADQFLQEMRTEAPSSEILITEFAEALLGYQHLSHSPEKSIIRIASIFDLVCESSEDINQTLFDIAENVMESRETKDTGVQRQTLELISELRGKMQEAGLAATELQDFVDALPKRLEELVDVDSAYGRPRLSLECLEKTYYPEETLNVILPIRVTNSVSNAVASNFSLRVSCQEDKRLGFQPATIEHTPLFAENPIPTLRGTSSCDLIYRVQLKPDLISRIAELPAIRFQLMLRHDGEEVLAQQATVEVAWKIKRQDMPNPYQWGAPVRPEGFLGREKELTTVRNAIMSNEREKTPLVTGIRRIGKTSFADMIVADSTVTSRYATIYKDLSAITTHTPSTLFLKELAEEIREKAVEGADIPGKTKKERKTKKDELFHQFKFHRDEFHNDPFSAFDKFINAFDSLTQTKRVLVILDEFEKVNGVLGETMKRAQRDGPLRPDEAFLQEVIAALRKVMMRTDCRLQLILTGTPNVLDAISYDDRIYGSCLTVTIGRLNAEEAASLIDQKNKGDWFVVLPDARQRLIRASGLQPYLLQVCCGFLLDRMVASGRRVATTYDVNEVIKQDVLPKRNYFTDYTNLVREGQEDEGHAGRSLLLAVARAEQRLTERKSTRQYVTVPEVRRQLQSIPDGESTLRGDLSEALRELSSDRDRPLLEENPSRKETYRCTIGLLGDYLREEQYSW